MTISPTAQTMDTDRATAYDSFAYKHSTIGSMEDLNAATLQDVQAFFKRYYAPNNAVLTLVGDFKSDDALAQIKKYFGNIPAQPAPPKPGCFGAGAEGRAPRQNHPGQVRPDSRASMSSTRFLRATTGLLRPGRAWAISFPQGESVATVSKTGQGKAAGRCKSSEFRTDTADPV